MRIEALLFASYRDLAGQDSVTVDVDRGATVADLVSRLRDEAPGLSGLPSRVAVAVNHEYAPETRVLEEGDEVALIPPVAGG